METFSISNRRYLGSKAKLADYIYKIVVENCSNVSSILDIFGGTGIIASTFNTQYKILVNDILKSNRYAYDTFFSPKKLSQKKLEKIIRQYNDIDVEMLGENYYSLNFSNTYLSKENLKKVGWIRADIDSKYASNEITEREKSALITSLLYAIDKIANTVGHYDAYRECGDLNRNLVLKMPEFCNSGLNKQNEIFSEDANQLAKKIEADVVYIDPPYNSRQYCDAYHFLENIALNTEPEVFGKAKKMDRKGMKSLYCSSKATEAFDDLITSLKCKYILVSYNNTGEKANPRSNAKINDIDILRILEKKGDVKVFEKNFNLFTTGKTNVSNHKERIFFCTVNKEGEKKKKHNHLMMNQYVQSPLNYTGGKYRLLKQLDSFIPKNIEILYDVFCGGANVGANIKAKKTICVDSSKEVIALLNLLKKYDPDLIINKLEKIINTYKLSDTYRNGYLYYGTDSNSGVGKHNKESFLKLREEYNRLEKDTEKSVYLLFTLILYSFNNQIRFNSKGEFNLPVGKRDLNNILRKKIRDFSNLLHQQQIEFINNDFRNIDIEKINNKNAFIYLDPPYLLGNASYNENGGWTKKDETDLLSFLTKCNEKKIRFALSNVLKHKNMKNEILIQWCLENKLNINHLEYNYKNSNYHANHKESDTEEVLITNYLI